MRLPRECDDSSSHRRASTFTRHRSVAIARIGTRPFAPTSFPGDPSPSILALQAQLRRYFGDGERYLSFRYGRGAAPFEIRNLNEVGVLDSSSYTGEIYWKLGRRLLLNVTGGISGDDRVDHDRLTQYYFSTTLGYKF